MDTIQKASKVALSVVVIAVMVSFATAADAALINGNFELGDLTGWGTFTTAGGTLGFGFPQVDLFDTNNDTVDSLAAILRVGRTGGIGPREGGGIFQNVVTSAGSLSISASIATLDDAGSNNLDGGLFELLFDGVVVDSFDFEDVMLNVPEFSTLSADLGAVTAGVHEVRFRMSREFLSDVVTPRQFIDDVVLSGSAVDAPEPASLFLLAAGLAGIAAVRRGGRGRGRGKAKRSAE